MKRKLTKALLGLALLGFIIPAAGCDLRQGSYGLGSFSDAVLGFDIVPAIGGFDVFDEQYDVTEFQVDVTDDYSSYDSFSDSYDGSYFDDGYYDDGFGGYDGWKKKKAD